MRKLFRLPQCFLICVALLISSKSFATDCPSTIKSALTSDCIALSTGLEITSSGSIKLSTITSGALQITREVTGQIINSGEINGLNGQVYIRENIIGGFTNTLTGNIHGNYTVSIGANSTLNSFSNAGFIGTDATTRSHYGGVITLWSGHITGGFINSRDIKAVLSADGFIGDAYGIRLVLSTDSITGGFYNSGTIASARGDGIQNGGLIDSITNTGTITGSGYGISNYNYLGTNIGTIGTLNNSQGALSSALTYQGNLPTNYNIIINSSSDFGKIIFTLPSGSTTFGISSLTGTNIGPAGTRYQNVISGLASTSITNEDTLLTYTNGLATATYKLVVDDLSAANTWDLLILSMLNGPSATDTQASLNTQSHRLRSAFNSTMASANFANMNAYDCNLFDKNNMCISAGGRITTIDNPSSNHSAALVVLGHKISPHIRIGGFLDQSGNHNMPSGVDMSNKNPMMGAFAVWNHQADGLGFQMKLANAYLDKDVTTSRAVIGTSEAGRGRTDLNTQSYVGELSYAFNYQDSTIVRPYFAVRYTNIKQDAYTEDTTASVTAPLTYAKLSDRSTTALMGVKLNHSLTPKTNLTASLGIEQDINHQVDKLTATGVADLTSENFNNNIKRTRPVASAGAYYAVAKNQRLSGEVYYQQLPFQSTGSATAYFNYMMGF